MNIHYIVTASLMMLLAAPAQLHADAKKVNAPPGKEYVFDESLGKRGVMEIYLPPGHDPAKPVPGIILFHGGAWVSGNLKDFRYQANYFASRGLVAATSHYAFKPRDEKRGPDKRIYTNVSGRKAIRWFRAHAKEFGIDPARIIAGGGSAGGQTALGASLNTSLDTEGVDTSVDASVAAYVLFNPANRLARDGVLEPHFKPKTMPPTIAFFGTSDQYLQGYQQFHDAMIAGGAPQMEIWYAAWQPHAFFKKQPWADACLIQADRFLTKLGYLTGEPTLSEPSQVLTATPDLKLPPEVLQREVYILKKKTWSKEWMKANKADRLESAPRMTIGEALKKGYIISEESIKP